MKNYIVITWKVLFCHDVENYVLIREKISLQLSEKPGHEENWPRAQTVG
jgi:hypothetical protein